MNYEFIQSHCLSKKGAEEDYKPEWDAIRYSICGKMFALVGNNSESEALISVKNIPEEGEELREKYSDIIPGYHLNKRHWSSVFLNGTVPATVLKQMLDSSYSLVFNALPRKLQDAILSQ
jgi:predicted DNA-binding protein (MmcQ/YjbR family)